MTPEPSSQQQVESRKRALDLTVTVSNVIKLAGLVLGIKTGFGGHPSPVVLALAGFMMAGAQLSERTVMAVIDRFFGRVPEPPQSESKSS